MALSNNAVISSVDEKFQIQAAGWTQPKLLLYLGLTACRAHDYKRNCTVNLYTAFDILTGKVMGRLIKRHHAKEFLDFLK